MSKCQAEGGIASMAKGITTVSGLLKLVGSEQSVQFRDQHFLPKRGHLLEATCFHVFPLARARNAQNLAVLSLYESDSQTLQRGCLLVRLVVSKSLLSIHS